MNTINRNLVHKFNNLLVEAMRTPKGETRTFIISTTSELKESEIKKLEDSGFEILVFDDKDKRNIHGLAKLSDIEKVAKHDFVSKVALQPKIVRKLI